MDPAFLALGGSFVGGVVLQIIARASRAGSVSYDDVWDDPKYVKMIHQTRRQEAELDIDLTPCYCSTHKIVPKPIPKPPKGPASVSRGPIQIATHKDRRQKIVDGYFHYLPTTMAANAVLSHARYNEQMHTHEAFWKCLDDKANVMACRTLSVMRVEPEPMELEYVCTRKILANDFSELHKSPQAKRVARPRISTGGGPK